MFTFLEAHSPFDSHFSLPVSLQVENLPTDFLFLRQSVFQLDQRLHPVRFEALDSKHGRIPGSQKAVEGDIEVRGIPKINCGWKLRELGQGGEDLSHFRLSVALG